MSWGVRYYAFPVLPDTISHTEGWSHPALTAAFSLGLVVNAIAGIGAGRVMQRHGPRALMTGASALGVLSVLVIATAPNLGIFFAGWVLAGVAMSGTMYAPAFAAVTVWFGEHRVRALTAITLVAGLASTVFAPRTARQRRRGSGRRAQRRNSAGARSAPGRSSSCGHSWPSRSSNS